MALYAIGDIQGCFTELQQLLERIRFDPAADRLWFTGDLVNRGPRSLDTLRFVKNLGDRAVSVLGNHDLHLLAVAQNPLTFKRTDTFGDILTAPDAAELIDWLRQRPLMHSELGFCLVHAGLWPQWTLENARRLAGEVERALRGAEFNAFLAHLYGNRPDRWSESLRAFHRLRFITNAFTRMRYCTRDGRIDLKEKSRPGAQAVHLIPWFEVPDRQSRDVTVLFGHWSSLGFYAGNGCYGLDSGCLWGGELTALRLDGKIIRISLPCPRTLPSGGDSD
jgi:bis(5'-nucleosyl)-tetraphosphatase (symmetrical)